MLASRLLGDGALVKAYDPVAIPYAAKAVRGILLCDNILSVVKDSDAVVLVTEWGEFAELPLEEMKKVMRRPLIIDGRNFLDPHKVRAAGFTYEGIGRV
ncbi:MAG: UDP-glucose/GDP-mannose dehydrogenase family protein [Actinobacteria bacterium]|nr:UDP-glucose/GDP-mannose dehydrogenase family protein [Actinomycetota bacterium]